MEYKDNYSKTSSIIIMHYYRNEPALNDNSVTTNFPDNKCASFKF